MRMTLVLCVVSWKLKSHQFMHTCLSHETNEQKSRRPRSVFMTDPVTGPLLLSTLYVRTLVTCIYVKIWNSNPVPYAHCGVIFGNMCHGFLIGGVSVPEWPAVWRWAWWWMGGHRKGWIESEKLLTRGGGSQTWQGELGYCGSHFHNVHHCSNWVHTDQLSVLMTVI